MIFLLTFHFLGTYQVSTDVENMIILQSYFSTLMLMSLAMGAVLLKTVYFPFYLPTKQVERQDNSYSKLPVCEQLSHLMDGINGYLDDAEPALWGLKHEELIWIFTKYYSQEELRVFFHTLDTIFKSIH